MWYACLDDMIPWKAAPLWIVMRPAAMIKRQKFTGLLTLSRFKLLIGSRLGTLPNNGLNIIVVNRFNGSSINATTFLLEEPIHLQSPVPR